MTEKTVYRFPKTSVGKRATKKMISVYPMLICALIAAFIIANHIENNEFIENTDLLFISAGMAGIFMIGGFFSGRKAIAKVLVNTQFVTDENAVEKIIPNGENTYIRFRDIQRFHETKNGILIKTKDKRLQIPSELTGFDVLSKNIRSHIHTHIISYQTKFKIHQSVLNNTTAIGVLFLVVGFFIAESKEHRFFLGIPLFLFMCLSFLKIIIDKKNKHLETSTIVKAVTFTVLLLGYLIYVSIWQ